MADLTAYRDTRINEANLSGELTEQASKFLYVAEQTVKAQVEYELYKHKLEVYEGQLDQRIRTEAEASKTKITEKSIEQEIARDSQYQAMKEHLIKLKGAYNLMDALRESWYMRKDMIIQLAIKSRAEMENLAGDRVKAAAGGA